MNIQEQHSQRCVTSKILLIFEHQPLWRHWFLLVTLYKLNMGEGDLWNLIGNFIKFSEQLFSKTPMVWPGVWCGIPASFNQKI